MIELHVIKGIVIILEEVPPADVVDIAIGIVIEAIAEDRDEIPRIKDPISVGVEGPRVIGIILNVEDPVAV